MDVYSRLIRPFLFRLPPEEAQDMVGLALRLRPLWDMFSKRPACSDPRLALDVAGLSLRNPVGLAAGLDKDCRYLYQLASLGFGYLVGGTVTPKPRPGNPGPRLLRLPRDLALVNAMGFPSEGMEVVAQRLEKMHLPVPLVLSIAALDIEGFLACHRRLEPLVQAMELNISSPNTAGIRVFQEPPTLARLLASIASSRKKPLFVKLPPYFDGEGQERVLSLARVCAEHGMDGLTVINTRPVQEPRLKVGQGGLSGKPLFPHMLRVVHDVRTELGQGPVINACGGIFTGEEALAALEAGANTVQLYTSMVYRGPGVVEQVSRELLRRLDSVGVATLKEVGSLTGDRKAL